MREPEDDAEEIVVEAVKRRAHSEHTIVLSDRVEITQNNSKLFFGSGRGIPTSFIKIDAIRRDLIPRKPEVVNDQNVHSFAETVRNYDK